MEGSTPRRRHIRVSDGTRLACELSGLEGGPTVMLFDGISCDGYAWRYLKPWLGERFRLVHVHYRGHGRSGLPRDPAAVTVPHLARDMAEILDRLELSPAICVGHSMGVQVILELAWRYPHHVRAGVLLCGSSGRLLDTFKETDLGMRILPRIRELTERHTQTVAAALRRLMPTQLSYQVATWSELNKDLIRREDFMPYLEHFATMPPDLFVRMLQDAASRSADHFLGRLHQPMLVVAGDRDGFTPARVSEQLAHGLPLSEYVMLEGGSHTAPLELPEAIEAAIAGFFETHGLLTAAAPEPEPRSDPGLAATFRQAAGAR